MMMSGISKARATSAISPYRDVSAPSDPVLDRTFP